MELDGDALVNFVTSLVGTPSPSGEEGAVAALVRAEMERLGYAVEVDALGTVTGTIDAGDGPCVLLDAHMDTVGVSDRDAWSADPAGELRDGRLYGRGSVDMKGPLAALVHGVAAAGLRRGRVVVSRLDRRGDDRGVRDRRGRAPRAARRGRDLRALAPHGRRRPARAGGADRGRARAPVALLAARPRGQRRRGDGRRAARGARAGAARAPRARPGDPRGDRRHQPPVPGAVGPARPLHRHLRPAHAARRDRGRRAGAAARGGRGRGGAARRRAPR